MNMRQIHIFVKFCKAIRQFVFWKSCEHGCEPEIVQKKSKQKMTQESKQKQFQVHNHVCNSYKTCKSTLLCIGNSEEN